MSRSPVEVHVRAAAAAIGLHLDDASFDAVAANTRILQALQAQFMDLDLPPDLDPASLLHL